MTVNNELSDEVTNKHMQIITRVRSGLFCFVYLLFDSVRLCVASTITLKQTVNF